MKKMFLAAIIFCAGIGVMLFALARKCDDEDYNSEDNDWDEVLKNDGIETASEDEQDSPETSDEA